jgi:hypothetical protein
MSLSQNATGRTLIPRAYPFESLQILVGVVEDCATFETADLACGFPVFSQDIIDDTAVGARGCQGTCGE